MFNLAGNTPLAWVASANGLVISAQILLKKYNSVDIHGLEVGDSIPEEAQVLSSVMLLYGFGIECLLKALWLKRGNTIVDDGKYIGIKGVQDHKLHELADALSFRISKEERELLIRISVFITSTGRYPIAKNWNETRIKKYYKGGYGSPTHINSGDFPLLDDIVDRIQKEIEIYSKPKVLGKADL